MDINNIYDKIIIDYDKKLSKINFRGDLRPLTSAIVENSKQKYDLESFGGIGNQSLISLGEYSLSFRRSY